MAAPTQTQALSAILFLYRKVLGREIDWVDGVVRASRPRRLPTVPARSEVKSLLSELRGRDRLMAALLYGAGLRLMECLRLRLKDIDLERGEITVRQGKGDRDRVTVLPSVLKAPLAKHLEGLRREHQEDVRQGLGVSLPHALARKYPNASHEWAWWFIFPAARIWSCSVTRTCGPRWSTPTSSTGAVSA